MGSTQLLSLVESAWTAGGTPVEDSEDAVLHDFSSQIVEEQLTLATLQRLNKIRAIVQEHLGYAPGGVLTG